MSDKTKWCPRCDGMGRVIHVHENGLSRALPAYPPTPNYCSLPCAMCRGDYYAPKKGLEKQAEGEREGT